MMTSGPNGQDPAGRDPTRRLRFDDLASIAGWDNPRTGGAPKRASSAEGHSGRLFVLASGVALLLIWGTMYLVFRDWRARYRARAQYGATHVVRAIDPLEAILPPGVDRTAWRDAVDQTRAMLLTVTASNLLDVKDMDRLRTELDGHVAQACRHPETALLELAAIWDRMADRAEFLLKDSGSSGGARHPRPGILPLRSEKPRARPSRSAAQVASHHRSMAFRGAGILPALCDNHARGRQSKSGAA
jgi:hypothetical protein